MRSSSSSASLTVTLHILLLLLLLLASTLPPSSQSENDDDDNGDMIDRICKKTPFFDLCSTTLRSNPLTPKSDLKAIAFLILNDILHNATDTLSYIESLIKRTSDRRLEQSLAFCAESYIPIVKYTLPQATDAVSRVAAYCVGDAEKEVEKCDWRLAWSNLSPLEDRNGVVHKLVGVASAIVRLLLKA